MISILIPSYNEEKHLVTLVQGLEKALKDAALPYRILVPDDGSSERFTKLLDELAGRLPLETVRGPENRYPGAVVRDGLQRMLETCGNEDFIIFMDADNAHPPHDILCIYDRLLDGPDVVVASRYKKGGDEMGLPGHRVFLSRAANALFKLLFPIEGISDYTNSFRGMRAHALKQAWGDGGAGVLEEQGFTVMPEILLRLRGKGLVFSEIPLVLRYELEGGAGGMRIAAHARSTLGLMLRMFVRGLRGRKG